jgi:hypothetical protein
MTHEVPEVSVVRDQRNLMIETVLGDECVGDLCLVTGCDDAGAGRRALISTAITSGLSSSS